MPPRKSWTVKKRLQRETMIDSHIIQNQALAAFNTYALEGAFPDKGVSPAVFSHVCFKFQSTESYKEYVEESKKLGRVIQEEFNGKEISWCALNEPLEYKGLVLKWLELVEPKVETNSFDGVTSLGCYVDGLIGTKKTPSADGKMIFRYQPQLVHPKL